MSSENLTLIWSSSSPAGTSGMILIQTIMKDYVMKLQVLKLVTCFR